jgi:hypothetical protein
MLLSLGLLAYPAKPFALDELDAAIDDALALSARAPRRQAIL